MTQKTWLWPIRIVTAVIGVGVLAFGVESVVTLFVTRQHTEVSVVTAPVRRLQVDVGNGDVDVHTGAANSPVRVSKRLTDGFRTALASQSLAGGVLTLKGDCSGGWPLDNCSVGFDVEVPPGTVVVSTAGSGDISFAGLSGSVTARTGSGDIHLERVSGPVRLQTGSGDIRAEDVSGTTIWSKTGSGDVNLQFDAAPAKVTVKVGSGDVHIDVPDDGTSYLVLGHSGSGDRSVEVPQRPGETRVMQVDTGSGDVHINPSDTERE